MIHIARDAEPTGTLPPYGFIFEFDGLPRFDREVGWYGQTILQTYTAEEFDEARYHGSLEPKQCGILCPACDTLAVIDETRDRRDEMKCDNCEMVVRKNTHPKGSK